MDLKSIKGIGERMANRIIREFGGEDEFLKAAYNYEVDRLARMEGISQRRAVDIINEVLGNPSQEFLKTDRAVQLYEDIIERILEHASTDYARNRIMLLSPGKDQDKILENLKLVTDARETVLELPRDDLKLLLRQVGFLGESRPRMEPGQAILVESREDYDRLLDRGLNRYVTLITLEEIETIAEYDLVVYAYKDGALELDDATHLSMVSVDSSDFELVPATILQLYHENRDALENAAKVRDILGWESVLKDVITILNSLDSYKVDEGSFDEIVDDVKVIANSKMKEAIKKIDLSGDEVLDILNKGMPSKIQEILDQVLEDSRQEIQEKTGCHFDPFLPKYPLEVDEKELERVKKQEMGKKYVQAFENKVTAARELSILQERIERELQEVLEFDYLFTLGCFAHDYDLQPAKIGDGFSFREALHLNLVKDYSGANNADHDDLNAVQRIDYSLEYPDNVVLLTGANSGGKTTLLETMAQISIMAQMGLPVSARDVQVKLVDEIYFFSKKRSLDAGAFESFLRTFMPIVVREEDKLILLDELEAITELEAAVKIISSFIDFIRDSGSFGIIVTHMAREILKNTSIRVDGIEATGLDEEYNLLVDRTPKMNYFARSTPELILKRVYEKSDGDLRKIYGEMLEKFK